MSLPVLPVLALSAAAFFMNLHLLFEITARERHHMYDQEEQESIKIKDTPASKRLYATLGIMLLILGLDVEFIANVLPFALKLVCWQAEPCLASPTVAIGISCYLSGLLALACASNPTTTRKCILGLMALLVIATSIYYTGTQFIKFVLKFS